MGNKSDSSSCSSDGNSDENLAKLLAVWATHFAITQNALTALLQVSRHFGPGHFGPKTFRYRQTGAEVSRQFDTSVEVSRRHFGTGNELSQTPYIIYHFYPTIFCYNRPYKRKV